MNPTGCFGMLVRVMLIVLVVAAVRAVAQTPATPTTGGVPADYKGTPYKGTAQVIPGRVEFENFDEGGYGVGFATQHHEGTGSANDYRPGDKPQLCVTNTVAGEKDAFADGTLYPSAEKPKSIYIGYTRPGDWVRCTVNVQKAGLYKVSSTFGSETDQITFDLRFNGVNKTGPVKLQGTSGYHNWRKYDNFAIVQLDAGLQMMQFTVGSVPHVNYDYLEFTYDDNQNDTTTAPAPPPPPSPAAKVFFKLDAAAYTEMLGVQKENADSDVGFFDANDWLSYKDQKFEAEGNAINMNIASGNDGGAFELRIDTKDGTKIGSFTVASTGGWANWQDITVPITPQTGTHTLYIVGTSGTGICNLKQLSLVMIKAPKTP